MGKYKVVKLSQTFTTARQHNQVGSAPQAPKAGQNGHN
jgi:hypothetical protein